MAPKLGKKKEKTENKKPEAEKAEKKEKKEKIRKAKSEKKEKSERKTVTLKSLKRDKEAVAESTEAVFGAATPAAPDPFSSAFDPEGDGFIAGVRSAEPVLSVDEGSKRASWMKDLVPAIAGGALLMAFMSLFVAATWSTDVIPFLIPGAVLYAGLTMLGSIRPGKPRWIASAVIGVLLIASMAVFHGTIGGGIADIINEFYDAAEEAQAYIYKRIPGEGGDSIFGAIWASCLIGLLASLPPANARRISLYAVTIIAMLAFAYYGLIPSWICVAVLLAALLIAVSRGSILSSLPLLLAVMLVFGAVVLIDPGENYGISRMDENFRDKFALNSLLIQGPDETPDDLSGIDDIDDPTDDSKTDKGFENDLGSYTGIISAVVIAAAIAAAIYLLWRRLDKKRKAIRAGLDSKDPREAVTAMFPYSVRWLKAGGVDTDNSIFGELTPAVEYEFSKDYADRYRDMYLLWREAAYSDHDIEEADRADMEKFVKDTAEMVKDKLNFTERINALLKYAL